MRAGHVAERRIVVPAEVALLASVFVIAACGLVYELAAGALASYLLGDSVLQFSTVIGTYLFAMGIGSWLSRFVQRQLVAQFLRIELLVGLLGGLLPAALFAAHSSLPPSAGRRRLPGAAVRRWCCWWARWWGWRSRW
jgi:spermidine synthase